MPHKVNPIDFENAEGNLGLANALLDHLSAKLPIIEAPKRSYRFNSVKEYWSSGGAYNFCSFLSIGKGLDKLILNKQKIDEDLEDNWAVVAEAIQTILRRENYPNPYESLKGTDKIQTR